MASGLPMSSRANASSSRGCFPAAKQLQALPSSSQGVAVPVRRDLRLHSAVRRGSAPVCAAHAEPSDEPHITEASDGSVTFSFGDANDAAAAAAAASENENGAAAGDPREVAQVNGSSLSGHEEEEEEEEELPETEETAPSTEMRSHDEDSQEEEEDAGASVLDQDIPIPVMSYGFGAKSREAEAAASVGEDVAPVAVADSATAVAEVPSKEVVVPSSVPTGRSPRRTAPSGRAASGAAAAPPPRSNNNKKKKKQQQPLLHHLDDAKYSVLERFNLHCRSGDLEAALAAVEEAQALEAPEEVLRRFRHKEFLRVAGRRGKVAEAFRFVELLSPRYTDGRTYNMLMTACAQNGDLDGALRAGRALQELGGKLDTAHYTNMIKAAAATANADVAFSLYSEMRKEGATASPCAMTITTVIDACTREIIKLADCPAKNRRTQLVLMERAYQVFTDGESSGIRPDLPMWNALINATGRAEQLDRSFHFLGEMQNSGLRPNDRTYSTLISACRLAGRQDMALKVYDRAMSDGVTQSLMVYVAAADACYCGSSGAADLDKALEVYKALQQHDVAPSAQFFSSLINVAGHAGRLELALSIQDDMSYEGIAVDNAARSCLLGACLRNGDLEAAQGVYAQMKGDRSNPHVASGYNAMVNAHAEAARLADAVLVVEDMGAAGVPLDKYTYGALIKACQRSLEPEMAFEIYKAMEEQRLPLDESMAFSLIRSCFNQLRTIWRPAGGYPPSLADAAAASGGSASRLAIGIAGMDVLAKDLLKAIGAKNVEERVSAMKDKGPASAEEWQRRAVTVYRSLLVSGQNVSMRTLDRVLACLRLPVTPGTTTATPLAGSGNGPSMIANPAGNPTGFSYNQRPNGFSGPSTWGMMDPTPAIPALSRVDPYGEQMMSNGSSSKPGSSPSPPSSMNKKAPRPFEIVFDSRAITLLEEAISSGMLPQFSLDNDDGCSVDLRSLLPTTAEVYVLAMFRSLEQRGSARYSYNGTVQLVVPPFNVGKIFMLSYLDSDEHFHESSSSHHQQQQQQQQQSKADDVAVDELSMSLHGDDEGDHAQLRTGLAVAAQLRRLKIYNTCRAAEGVITIGAREVTRWVRTRMRAAAADSNRQILDNGGMTGSTGVPAAKGAAKLAAQQRDIRAGF